MNLILKKILVLIFIAGVVCVNSSWAAMGVRTELVSGTIKKINNESVTLNDKKTYYALPVDLLSDLTEGQSVTLRYAEDAEGRMEFFEYALGINSLKDIPINRPKIDRNKY